MEQFFIKKDTLEATAEAIRNKTGIKEKIKPVDFPEKINEIETGVDVSGVTATAEDVLAGKVFVDAEGNEVKGTIVNRERANYKVTPTYPRSSILEGYYSGAGSVFAYTKEITITPTKENQVISATDGDSQEEREKFIAKVSVDPIPDEYQDVTSVTATADDVLAGKTIVDASGNEVTGGMTDNGAFSTNLSMSGGKTGFNIPKGYHNGEGVIKVLSRTKTVTPSKTKQVISDWDHQTQWYLESVTVNPIPDEYQDVSNVTATAEDVRAGKVFVDARGNPTEGIALIQTDMHLSIEDMVAPSRHYQRWFRLNGIVYAAVGLSSSWEIYRYDDGSWIRVVDEVPVSLGRPIGSTYAIEHNGVIHFFAENEQSHYVFDGITLSQKLDLPNTTQSVCLHQEKIFNYMMDNCIYQWDEVTDTWTLFIKNVASDYYFTHIFTANGFLYVKDNKTLYKITDSGKEKVGNIPISVRQLVVKDSTVVILNQGKSYNSPKCVYTYDLVTGAFVFLGNLPTSAEFMYICEDGSIRGLIDNDCPSDETNSFILEIRGAVATTNEDWIITLEDGSVITKKMMVVVTE